MPASLTRFHWYHGKITKEEAEWTLESERDGQNTFLVRQSATDLILSVIINNWIHHLTITYSPEGYILEGKTHVFMTISEMITYYQMFPVHENQVLGIASDRQMSGMHQNLVL